MTDLVSLLTLNSASGIGSVLYDRLVRHLVSVEAVAGASIAALSRVPSIGKERAEAIHQAFRDELGKRELELAAKHNIRIISSEDAEYPVSLKTIFDYPLVLYVKGRWPESLWRNGLGIAIVGSRRSTLYGDGQANKLGYTLANCGLAVVSGLARGIDAAAHNGALKCKGGYTVAVLGNGLSRVYPPEHKKLAERILDAGGALVSELPVQAPVNSRNFPARNRIISGLSLGVVVVEAPLRSGALITADLALDQGREVFAVPGKIDSPFSQGCHKLIKQGAKLVEAAEDVLEELPVFSMPAQSGKPAGSPADRGKTAPEATAPKPILDYKQELIINQLSKDEPKHIDQLIDSLGLPPAIISSTLLMLELKQLVRQIPGRGYIRSH